MNNPQKSWPLLGGVLAGLGASACCAGPLILLLLGVSGSWISHLTALQPYQPLFIALSLGLLWLAYRSIFQTPAAAGCEDGQVCATPRGQRIYRVLFWVVSGFIILAIASPYLLAFLLG